MNNMNKHDVLVRRQYRARVLAEHVRVYQEREGRPPTVRELGELMGLHSSATIHTITNWAVQFGYLERMPGSRGLRVPRPDVGHLLATAQ